MKIFEFQDYRKFIKTWIAARPKGSHGELQKLATKTKIHSSTLSQILKGGRDFTPEQVVVVSDLMNLNELETRYFLLLLQYSKSESKSLRILLENQMKEMRVQSTDLSQVLRPDQELTPEVRSIFYSNWFFSAIRILSSIEGFQNADVLAERLRIRSTKVREIIVFLVKNGLCVEENGKLKPGPAYTHLEAKSPLISRHHGNWRVRAMERHPDISSEELCYSAPMSIGKGDIEKVRTLAVEFIENVQKIRELSNCEAAYCLNLDWFEI